MLKIFPDVHNAPSEICINSVANKTSIRVYLGTNDMFKCLNALLRNWEQLQPEHKEIMSNFVDEFIIKMIDDRVSTCKI